MNDTPKEYWVVCVVRTELHEVDGLLPWFRATVAPPAVGFLDVFGTREDAEAAITDHPTAQILRMTQVEAQP